MHCEFADILGEPELPDTFSKQPLSEPALNSAGQGGSFSLLIPAGLDDLIHVDDNPLAAQVAGLLLLALAVYQVEDQVRGLPDAGLLYGLPFHVSVEPPVRSL